jgi:nucleotide-binding universal stress UspA family protein
MMIPGGAPVVVGVNGSSAGMAAVRLGAREAVARGRELRIVHAFTWPGLPAGGQPKGYAASRREADRVLRQAVTAAKRATPGVHVTGEVVDGQATRVLVQQSRNAELVVLGDDDLATSSRIPIDSVLLQTVSHAWCPVVVSRGLRPPTGPILVAVDGSVPSVMALQYAAEESARRHVDVEVVHVVEEPGAAAEAAGRKILDDAVHAVPGLEHARQTILTGDPAQTLVQASRHARMVDVGPRGVDGAQLLGPVAQELLRRGACPTVFVHRATADDAWSGGTVPEAGALAT